MGRDETTALLFLVGTLYWSVVMFWKEVLVIIGVSYFIIKYGTKLITGGK